MDGNKNSNLDRFIEDHVNKVEDAMGYDPSRELFSKQGEKDRIRAELSAGLNQFIDHIKKGFILLKETFGTLSIQDPEHSAYVNEANNFLNRDFNKDVNLSPDLIGDKSLKEFYNLSDHTLHSFYLVANYYYVQNRFQEAAEILFFLCLLDPLNAIYWQALGSANYFSGNYQDALYAYFVSFTLNPEGDDPRPLFYAARCYEAQLDFEKARDCIDAAIEILGNEEIINQELLDDAKQYHSEINDRLKNR